MMCLADGTVAVAHHAAELLVVIVTTSADFVACPIAGEAECRRHAIRHGFRDRPVPVDQDLLARSGSNRLGEGTHVRDKVLGIVGRAEDLLLGEFALAFELEAVLRHESARSGGHGRHAQEHPHHSELALDRHEPPVANLVRILGVSPFTSTSPFSTGH
jgi:hypothetical protein